MDIEASQPLTRDKGQEHGTKFSSWYKPRSAAQYYLRQIVYQTTHRVPKLLQLRTTEKWCMALLYKRLNVTNYNSNLKWILAIINQRKNSSSACLKQVSSRIGLKEGVGWEPSTIRRSAHKSSCNTCMTPYGLRSYVANSNREKKGRPMSNTMSMPRSQYGYQH